MRTFKVFAAVATVAAVLIGSSVVFAAPRDAASKMSGNYGFGGAAQSFARRAAPTYRYYSAPAPTVIRTEPSVAQTPTDRRTFSVEPGQAAPQASPSDCMPVAPQAVAPQAVPPTAQQPSRTTRSYSIEPTPVAPRTYVPYSRPMMRGSRDMGWDRDAGSKMRGNYGR